MLSVKSGHVTVAHVRDLRGVLERERAEIRVLITVEEPTAPMRREAAATRNSLRANMAAMSTIDHRETPRPSRPYAPMGGSEADLVVVLLVSAVSGVLSALVTLLVGPRLQHQYWRYQRREELQLATIRVEPTRCGVPERLPESLKDSTAQPSDEFFQAPMRVTAEIKVLFSDSAFRALKDLDVMFGPGLGSATGERTSADFIRVRDAALRALYAEVVSS